LFCYVFLVFLFFYLIFLSFCLSLLPSNVQQLKTWQAKELRISKSHTTLKTKGRNISYSAARRNLHGLTFMAAQAGKLTPISGSGYGFVEQ
jgi:hypothetical protein